MLQNNQIELLHELPLNDCGRYLFVTMAVRSPVHKARSWDNNSYIEFVDLTNPLTIPLFIIQFRTTKNRITIITDGHQYRQVSCDNGIDWFTCSDKCTIIPSKSMVANWIRDYVSA